jgi:hypothetical protein
MLIDNMIMMRGVTGLSSDPGVGKTFLALEMARAVVTGGNFMGKFPAHEGAVCFVGQDASILEYAQQVRKVVQDEYKTQEATLTSYEDKLVGTDFDDKMNFIIQPGLRLDSAQDVRKLAESINKVEHYYNTNEPDIPVVQRDGSVVMVHNEPTKHGVSLLILDTLASMHKADENNNMEMQVVFQNLRYLAEATKAAVLITHHHPAGEPRWRGATAQLGALDGHIMLQKKLNHVELSLPKFRGIRIEPFTYVMEADEERVIFKVRQQELEDQARMFQPEYQVALLMNYAGQTMKIQDMTDAAQALRPLMSRKQVRKLWGGCLDWLLTEGTVTPTDKATVWRVADGQDQPQALDPTEEPGDSGEESATGSDTEEGTQ